MFKYKRKRKHFLNQWKFQVFNLVLLLGDVCQSSKIIEEQ